MKTKLTGKRITRVTPHCSEI